MPKIGSRVLDFTLLLVVGTAATVGASKLFSKSEEEKEAEIRRKFPELVKQSEDNKKNMQAFFNAIKKDPNDREKNDLFNNLLKGGKGEVKNQSTNRLVVVEPLAPKPPAAEGKKPEKAAEKK